jgi:poly-gamma-glutamate synthesis protein (capsule biosynthesis protein)
MSPPFLSHSQNTGNIDGNERLPLLLSLANNHTVNGGYEGILTTKQLLQQHDILSLGAGTTPDEAKMLLVSSGNVKLCFQAYSYDGKQNLKV